MRRLSFWRLDHASTKTLQEDRAPSERASRSHQCKKEKVKQREGKRSGREREKKGIEGEEKGGEGEEKQKGRGGNRTEEKKGEEKGRQL